MKYLAFPLLLAASLSASVSFAQETTALATAAPLPAPATAVERPQSAPQPLPAAAPTAVTVELTGYVLDERKRPLCGATVLLKGTQVGASTDATGHYSLLVPPGINTLLFDFVGHESRELSASNFLPLTVVLPAAGTKGRSRK